MPIFKARDLFLLAVVVVVAAAGTTDPPTPPAPPGQTCSGTYAPPFYCNSSTPDCCGNYTADPQCMNDATGQCCQWDDSATVCNLTDSCCGAGGPGGSSLAFCCNASTFCCKSSSVGYSTCCDKETEQCCQTAYNFNLNCCKKKPNSAAAAWARAAKTGMCVA